VNVEAQGHETRAATGVRDFQGRDLFAPRKYGVAF
jgi:hypothetical protein